MEFARRGAQVVVNDLGAAGDGNGADDSVAAQVVREIEAAGGTAVANTDSVEDGARIIQQAMDSFGRVDVLINNAGILSINALEDESMAMIQAVMNTNFFGPVRCMKAVVPAMRERRQGLIINLSSIAGRMAVFSHSAYGPSKFALEAASEVAAQELAPFGVRIALVEPGIIATDMAVANLPQPRADSKYPSGRRMVAMNADAAKGTPPSVVAGAVLDIVSGRNTAFRTLCGDDSQMFIGMRARMSDDAWIAMSDTLDDGVFFDRMTAAMQG
jgi:NAD(P)-dependent dehydrogenase (short-subunit alcohol dehydrogenase family)